ncbi:MAG: PAS domain S-box protein [Chloracidobacterium sp.]|uniref:histidine kinase n=1 Tax=Chloracidobacterium validum TaxID=2821543 RepID=A0ABX8BA28_9BACT|nr:PAS domain S-box protein [Chloracidobacterium validum]QUW02901.1 PAS domain S-box protein [Chloracidobacterium validum]
MLHVPESQPAQVTDDHQVETGRLALPSISEAALLRQIVNHVRHAFWAATLPEKRLLFVNQEFESIWGFSPLVAIHEPHRLRAAIHPDDRERWEAAALNPAGSDIEYRICRPDGQIRWVRESVFPVRDRLEQPVLLVGLAKDITAYKRAGEALRESEEQFRCFFNLTPSPGCIFEARTGKIIAVNVAFEQLTGYAQAEAVGRSLAKLDLWLDQTLPRLVMASLRQGAGSQRFDLTIKTRAGGVCDLMVSANLLTIGGRQCIATIATDMTDMNRLRRQLTESEARFRTLVENAPDILICTTLDGDVTYLNHPDLGYQEQDLLGHNLLDRVVDANSLREAMRQVVSTGQVVSFEAQFQFADGHQRWCAGRVAPIWGEDTVTELVFRLRDIEERKAAALQLKKLNADISEANAKLREIDRLKARFAAMLVHDLRSPLGCVYSALELFEAIGKPDEETRHLVGVARNSLERALNLLSEVQEVYRSEETGIVLERAPLDVTEVLQEAVDGVRPEAERKGVILRYQPSETLPQVRLSADRGKLLRVFTNLLTNAVKFTPKDGAVMLTATVTNGAGVNIGRDFIEVSVTDTGIGIPPEDLPYVFDLYRQSRNHRMGVGVGLGLSIVKSIVAAHGGDVRVDSQLGVGTSFTVSLPIPDNTESVANPMDATLSA